MGRAGRRLYAGQPQRRQIPSAPFLDPERQQEKSPLPSAASRLGTTGEFPLPRRIRDAPAALKATCRIAPSPPSICICNPEAQLSCPCHSHIPALHLAPTEALSPRLRGAHHSKGSPLPILPAAASSRSLFGIPGTFPVYPVSLAAHSFSYLFWVYCVSLFRSFYLRVQHDSQGSVSDQHGTRSLRYNGRQEARRTTTTAEATLRAIGTFMPRCPNLPIHDDVGEFPSYQGGRTKPRPRVAIKLDWATRLNVSHLCFGTHCILTSHLLDLRSVSSCWLALRLACYNTS
ncbi:hypothetical protein DTO280E4_5318 [Paecilomyces variotii]|nr:hypothetical protein DTO280E4_5318 [Paecilomyces variotii]